jgi:hypothetical protein
MKSRAMSKNAPAESRRAWTGGEDRVQRAARARRRRHVQDHESHRQVEEFLYGGGRARA